MLHRQGVGCGADFVENARPVFAVGLHADFEQFMDTECALDFREHAAGQAFVADQHDRLERVGAGPQRSPACGG